MKKLVFIFAAFVAVSFSACGNKNTKSENSTKTDSTEVIENQACEAACDSAAHDHACEAACDSAAHNHACEAACDSAAHNHACKKACDSAAHNHACKSNCK